jgi:hypothetical protein
MADLQNNIELRSEKARNIIGKMPSILTRYGIGIIATILVSIVAGSFFFRFTPVYDATAQVNINISDTTVNIEIPAGIKQYDTTIVLSNNVPITLHLTVNQSNKVKIPGEETSLFDYVIKKFIPQPH